LGVEVVGLGVVVRGGGDDDVVGTGVGIGFVQRGAEVEFLVFEVVFDFGVFDGRLFAVEHRDFFGDDVERDHFVVLGEEDGVGKSDVAGSGDGYLFRGKVQGSRLTL